MSERKEISPIEIADKLSDVEILLNRIIEVDNRARDEIEQAQQAAAAARQELDGKKKRLREERLARAEREMDELAKQKKQSTERESRALQEQYQESVARLEETFAVHREEWLEEIVSRVTTL